MFFPGPLAISPIEYVGFLKSSLVESNSPSLQFYLLPGDPYMDQFVNLPNFNEDVLKFFKFNILMFTDNEIMRLVR